MSQEVAHETYRAVLLSRELQDTVSLWWNQERRCEPDVERIALELASCALRVMHAIKAKSRK